MQNIADREHLHVSFRSVSGDVVATTEFEGGAAQVRFPLREIAQTALSRDASSVLIRHSHPSGDPLPSRADVIVTRRIAAALALVDVAVDDHEIIAGASIFSFREAGLI